MQGGITADPARADRFYGALLDSRQVPQPSDGTVADRWLSRAWADQIASASQESREPFLRYWAGQWLEFAASRGITVNEALARWRHRIRVAEVSESAASARLAGQALQMAEATVSGMAPAVPVPDSPSSSPSTPPAAATGSPILTR